jgi:hypothetical protein
MKEFDINQMIDSMARTVIHELVHVVQHVKQKHRDSTEYRSYLGPKDEFYALFDIIDDQKRDPNTPEYKRWRKLYQASPQEIAAFAHDIANTIIQRNDLDGEDYYVDESTMSELVPEIMSEIKRYFVPKTPDERKVFNRYVKRVYQELKNHIDRLVGSK